MFDGLAFFHAEFLHQARDALGAEDAHQVVFQRQIKSTRAGVALAAAPTAQLVVDAPRFVALGAEHMQAAGGDDLGVTLFPRRLRRGRRGLLRVVFQRRQFQFEVAAEHDVGAAPGHVGGDGHAAGPAGLGDDLRFAVMMFGVQHLVRDVCGAQQRRQPFGGFNRRGADQHRLAARAACFDAVDNRGELFIDAAVHQVGVVAANHRPVGRDNHHFQTVDLQKLRGLGVGGAGHAGQRVIQAEIVLESYRRQGLVFLLNGDAFLRLDGLVQTVRPASPGHHAPGEFVDNHHLTVAHDVCDIFVKQVMRAQRRIQVMHQTDVADFIQTPALRKQTVVDQQLLGVLITLFG